MNKKFKFFVIFIVIFIVVLAFEHFSYKEFYSSYKDKILAIKIENSLENLATVVKNKNEEKAFSIKSITKDDFERICVISSYFPESDKFMNINYDKFKNWENKAINSDYIFSIFLINKDNVVPVKIRLYKLKPEQTFCSTNFDFKLYKKDSYIYLKSDK